MTGLPDVVRRLCRVFAAGLLLLAGFRADALAGPVDFDLGLHVPPIVVDSKVPPDCTVAWLIANTTTNDIFLARAQIAHGEGERPVDGRMPCPATIPPRVAERALDVCYNRALEPRHCVFADMSRGFESAPDIRNTAENGARCTSDKASHIAVACWMSNKLAVCDTGCGDTQEAAEAQAVTRCQDKQQRNCDIKASAPVAMP